MLDALRKHWPEYLIEALCLGVFMVSAGAFTVFFEYPGSPMHHAIANPDLRRALIGLPRQAAWRCWCIAGLLSVLC